MPHARSLLPFLLSGVADEVEANGVKALALVEAVGAANDAALGVDANGGGWFRTRPERRFPDRRRRRRRSRRRSRAGRPRRARRLVRALLPSPRPGRADGGSGVDERQTKRGARLLGTIAAFAEASASRHLGDLIKEIVAAVGDDDRDTAERVVVAARVLGAHVSPSHWLPIALDHVVADKGCPRRGRRRW